MMNIHSDGGLYGLTHFLYEGFDKILHKAIPWHNLPAEVMAEGFFGAYLATYCLQFISKKVVDKIFSGFDDESLPLLEKITVVGIPLITFMYALVDKNSFSEVIQGNPMDNLGILFAYLGGTFAVGQDLKKRRIKSFQERIEGLERKLR